MKKIFFLVIFLNFVVSTKSQIVTSFAGGFSFAEGNGISAHFNNPSGICSDSFGNIYVADTQNNRIRKITPSGTVSTFAGSGVAGTDDGIGTAAQFKNPVGVCVDITGNIFVIEFLNYKIRKITPSGTVSTFAGSEIRGYLDGTGTSAQFGNMRGICSDSLGNIYVADSSNNRIRKITPSGIVSTLAGSGPSGPGGYADGIGTIAQFNSPSGLCSDSSGNIYVADTNNNRIRKITPSGIVSTLAGSGVVNYADGIGTSAQFNFAIGLCSDSSGNIYVADAGNNRIRKITPSGIVSTLAGYTLASSFEGYVDGIGTAAQFRGPAGVCFGSSGNLYVSDYGNNRIRKITPSGHVSTFAGTTLSDGINISSRFNNPYGVCSDSFGNIYVADTQNNRIRKITPSGIVSTFAGSGIGVPGFADGIGTIAQFNSPCGLCSDSSGNIYVADTGNQRIRKITPSGLVSTFAGSGTWGYTDGEGITSQFYNPFGVCSDTFGNIYVADSGNHIIRKITPSGLVSTFAGSEMSGYLDGIGTAAQFYGPSGICSDSSGNIFVAEWINRRIRKITPSGVVSTLAGSGVLGYADGIGTAAQFTLPHGIAINTSGEIFVVDQESIRKITLSGVVSTYAGANVGGYLDGYGAAAQFYNPFGICINSSGEIFVADRGNNRIRKISEASSINPVSVAVPENIKCDSNNGFSAFDLTINDSTILAVQPGSPNYYYINYYETLTEANNNLNSIPSPENYFNIIPYNQTVYYRITYPLNNFVGAIGSIQLIIQNAPIAVTLNPIIVCDEDDNYSDSITSVNLTVQTPYIINSLNPVNYTVTFYTSNADALSGTNSILNPNDYLGSNNQTIWYRLQENAAICYGINSFQLIVNIPLVINAPPALSICDYDTNPNDLFTTFDLTVRDSIILGGINFGYSVTYYPNYPITSSSLAISNPTNYINSNPGVQTLGVRVTSSEGCYSDTNLTIRVLPIPTAPLSVPAIIKACNANIVYFDLTVNSTYIINGTPFILLRYFPTMTDAEQNLNEITNPTSYPYGGASIWIKITNNRIDYLGNYCYNLVEQELIVSNTPTNTPSSYSPYTLSDIGNNGYENFDLTSQINNILSGQSGVSVTFYPSLFDAQNNTNPITNPSNYTNTIIYNQTLGIRITNNMTGCYNISSIVISVLSLGMNENEIVPLKYFPNPVKINLILQSTKILQSVIIFNMIGQNVYEKTLNNTSGTLDLSSLKTGNYIAKIYSEIGQKVIRIVKE